METSTKTEEKKPIANDIERKREIISFQVSPEEKREITYKAVKDCGISVSEFIRTKIFMEPKKIEVAAPLQDSPLLDEERQIYEDKLKEVTTENALLKDEIVKIKVLKTEISPIENAPTKNENTLTIELEPEFKKLFDRIKAYRDKAILEMEEEDRKMSLDFNNYLKVILLRGFKRSYNNSCLNSGTGLVLSDLDEIIKIAELKAYEI